MELYNKILDLCKSKGVNITIMCKESGVSRGSLGDLKSGKNKSLSTDALSKIANYFSVSVDYLLGKPEQKEKLPDSTEELVEMIRQKNKNKGTAFFCGADGKVIDVPPEAESLILNLIETLDKNKK